MRLQSRLTLMICALALAGCRISDDPSESSDNGYQFVREVVGDTSVVRSVSGSAWGQRASLVPEISIGELDGDENYVFGRIRSLAVDQRDRILAVDALVPALRVYGSDGSYVETWGREGEGPGEFRGPDGGMSVLSDGRVVVRDPGNARLLVFSADGEPLDTWPVITGQYINRVQFSLYGDTILNPDIVNMGDEIGNWRTGMVRISPEGRVLDTLPVPDAGTRAPILRARSGGNNAEMPVPWYPREHWAWHPNGYFIHGVADSYSFSLLRDGDPLRIERSVGSTSVQSGERDQEEERVTRGMRWLDPTWRWDGPQIPPKKPAFSGLFVGRQGRIWVLRDGPAYEVVDDDYDPTDPDDVEIRWKQDRLFDAFESDGTFLGTIQVPRDFTMIRPMPLFDGDRVWAVTSDELDVQRIVRYRLAFPDSP